MPHMSVIENVFLGIEPRRFGLVQRRQMRRQYDELIARRGFELDGDAKVGALRTADQQKVEILRAVAATPGDRHGRADLVADERRDRDAAPDDRAPCASSGKTIVYVSHFLDEVLDLADTVTVLRSGRLVRTAPAAEETEESLVAGMFGAAAEAEHFEKPPHSTAPVVLDGRGLQPQGRAQRHLAAIRAGEIVGLAGLVGSGRTELARAIAGADPIDGGTIAVDGNARRIRSPADAMAAGMAFLPESRKEDGLFMELSLAANTTFADLRSVASRVGILRRRARAPPKTRQLLESLTSTRRSRRRRSAASRAATSRRSCSPAGCSATRGC